LELKYLKGVGPKRAEALSKIGITDIQQFLRLVPRIYLKQVPISRLRFHSDGNVLINCTITEIIKPRKTNHPYKLYVSDNTGIAEIPIFGGGEFRTKQFRLNDKFLFWGKLSDNHNKWALKLDYRDHLKIDDENVNEMVKFRLLPVYELSGELKKTWIRPLLFTKIVFNAFTEIFRNSKFKVEETLPVAILDSLSLRNLEDAIRRINFPIVESDIETSRRRLAFDELFYLEIMIALRKNFQNTSGKGISFNSGLNKIQSEFEGKLPFNLTNAQKKVISEIKNDMASEKSMNRLLQGDVGSGKTIVAVISMLNAMDNGYQSALMCPTEILAQQHYITIKNLTEKIGVNVTLLTGGQRKVVREKLLSGIKTGESNIIIGTHALIQDKVEFNKLGLIVIDEQHKFGVMQRAKLKEKGNNPDTLIMTATPIPRTLSLTVYGNLDVSIIDELPVGRIPVKTVLRREEEKPEVFEFIRGEVKKGRQVYIIFPLIEESEKLDLKAAETNFEILKNKIFPDLRVGMVHGRVLWYEKDEEMEKFKNKELDILVATTVIEVGIDIPNANIMLIEDAHRFGLSQLHQLRGRVGRGAEQSYCILISNSGDEHVNSRLQIMCETSDGFKIAEEDMKLRGPGEFFGTKQSGIFNFSCTDLNKDSDILIKARDEAFKIIEADPMLRMDINKPIRDNFIKNYKDSLYLIQIA